jgi:integrase
LLFFITVLSLKEVPMASANKVKVGGRNYIRVTDTSFGKRIQYASKIDKFTDRQWLAAHNSVMQCLSSEDKRDIASRNLKETVIAWLRSSKESKTNAKATGIKTQGIEAKGEISIKRVIESYLSDYCQPELNSLTAISRAKRQCGMMLSFLESNKIFLYSHLKRNVIKKYPLWRSRNKKSSADTVNQELRRLGSVIRHGVKYCGWQENYLLDGMKVKETQENTKTIRPFEISEVKTILAWLWSNAEKVGNWYLHDMALLSVCTGMEAKALSLLTPEWFKPDIGILRVYDKLVSGVIDAKTQNRARDIPLVPTMRKIFERGFVFARPKKKKGRVAAGLTRIHHYSGKTFERCEKETCIPDVNWHRFRHTCATARLSAGWQLIRVSRMLGHKSIGTTASHYAEYDLSASPAGFEGMVKVYAEFIEWLDSGYFPKPFF